MDAVVTFIMEEYEQITGVYDPDESALLYESIERSMAELFSSCSAIFGTKCNSVLHSALKRVRSMMEWEYEIGVEAKVNQGMIRDDIADLVADTQEAERDLVYLLSLGDDSNIHMATVDLTAIDSRYNQIMSEKIYPQTMPQARP